MRPLLSILACTAFACGPTEAPSAVPPVDASPTATPPVEAPTSDPVTTATGGPTATSTANAAPTTTTPAPRAAPNVDQRFLPYEASCTSDADCAATRFGVGERFACCGPCGAVAGTKAWVAKADATCKKIQASGHYGPCPPMDCGSPSARCDAGQCVTVP